jgi:alkanesulfonate monooxygenase SsuD/methylene tetrahydromethanopterin reductase-like flavin-dependent oxidoreductase (luciferase family)
VWQAAGVRLGISLSSSRSGDDGEAYAAGARSMIQRARTANEAGLDSLTLGDRHAMSSPYYQNVPMLGRLLAEWDASRPAGCLFLLPLWHPVLVAEQVATLATMTDVPFIIQTGIGGGRQQFAAMGRSLERRGVDLEESVRVVKALLSGQTVNSERFGLSGATISPLPPHGPEWWIGAGVPVALRRAASEGDAWYATAGITIDQLLRAKAKYEDACADAGRTARTIVRRDIIVLNDGNRARRLGDQLMARGYRGMVAENVTYGGVEEAIDQLSSFRAVGVSELLVRCMSVDDADAIETIECCAEVRRALA